MKKKSFYENRQSQAWRKSDKKLIEIMPYIEVDGIRTFTDSEILSIYDRTIKEGKGYIFKDGTIYNRLRFLEVMKNEGTFLYIIYYRNDLLGITWLNRFEGRLARIHWCMFDGISAKQKIRAGRYISQKLINMKDKEGNYIFDLLIGYMPASNKSAIQFVQMCGSKICGEIPNLIWDKEKSESEPGVIGYYQRG